MVAPLYTDNEYFGQFLKTLPSGPAWSKGLTSQLATIMKPFIQNFSRSNLLANNLLIDGFPATTVQLLPEWEDSLGLPGDCYSLESQTISQRQKAVVAKFAAGGGAALLYLTQFAANLGYQIKITDYAPTRISIDPVTGGGLPDQTVAWSWLITVLSGESPSILECEMRHIVPAHLRLGFLYGGIYHPPAPILLPWVSIVGGTLAGVGLPIVNISDGVIGDLPLISISAGVIGMGTGTVGSAPVWTTAAGTIGTFVAGTPITSVQLAATGAITFAVTVGSLPAGLTMTSGGLIAGTPTTAGAASFTVAATNSTGSTPEAFTAAITAAPLLSVLSTSGARIVNSSGATVILKGCNWHGAEGSNYVPHLLWQNSYTSMVDQIAALGFNVMRIPVAADMTLSTATSSINAVENPSLVGLTAIQVLDTIITYAGTKGIYTFLDCHRFTNGAGTDSAISGSTMPAIVAFWQMLATYFVGNPAVIGADCYNEPYTVTWSTLAGYYATIGNAIHAIAPNWLIICEGDSAFGSNNYWWGGQLAGAAATPVVLTHPNKLVYSAHDYGQSVGSQTWLRSTGNPSVAGYPNNCDAIWDAAWGYLVKTGIAPVIVGEFGGKLGFTGSGTADPSQADAANEVLWFSHLMGYMHANGVSGTFWTFPPQSGDTGGLLCDDGVTLQAGKVALLPPFAP